MNNKTWSEICKIQQRNKEMINQTIGDEVNKLVNEHMEENKAYAKSIKHDVDGENLTITIKLNRAEYADEEE